MRRQALYVTLSLPTSFAAGSASVAAFKLASQLQSWTCAARSRQQQARLGMLHRTVLEFVLFFFKLKKKKVQI